MEKKTDDNNQYKWGSIDNFITVMREMSEKNPTKLNDYIFNTQVYASVKYDGTNFGIDDNKQMYGRNKIIPPTAKSYQKAPLVNAAQINSALIKAKLIE